MISRFTLSAALLLFGEYEDIVEFSNDLVLEMRSFVSDMSLGDSKSLVPIHKSMHDKK
jgi:hypothetical protein